MNIFSEIKRKLYIFIGDIKWSGWQHPFWFTINASGYNLKAQHYRELKDIIHPGDIFLRRFEGYVDKWFIPGWWNHAGIYIGDEKIIHAIGEGVFEEDILNFMRTDHMIVLRVKDADTDDKYISEVVERAKSTIGKGYDFDFDFGNKDRFSCTELAAHCHPKVIFETKRRWNAMWKKVLVADDFLEIEDLQIVWDSREREVGALCVR